MNDSTPHQLRFPSSAGFTVRADFEGGAVSSDFGALLLQGVERQTGLIARLASAIEDKRHPSYIDHSLTDLLRQRIFQTACGYADGNDANSLRHDPMFKLAAARAPLPLRAVEPLEPELQHGLLETPKGEVARMPAIAAPNGKRVACVGAGPASLTVARDLAPRGIAVALIHPGMVATEMTGRHGIPVEESVRGYIARLDEVALENTGRFWHATTGEALPW